MQNKEQSALFVHSENYIVPKGQERVVHFKIAKVTSDGGFLEKPRIVKSRVKAFETIERVNLENAGYTIEILYHPQGKYTNVKIVDKNLELARKDAEIAELKAQLESKAEVVAPTDVIAEKDAEIAELKAEVAKYKAKAKEAKEKAKKAKEEGKEE